MKNHISVTDSVAFETSQVSTGSQMASALVAQPLDTPDPPLLLVGEVELFTNSDNGDRGRALSISRDPQGPARRSQRISLESNISPKTCRRERKDLSVVVRRCSRSS